MVCADPDIKEMQFFSRNQKHPDNCIQSERRTSLVCKWDYKGSGLTTWSIIDPVAFSRSVFVGVSDNPAVPSFGKNIMAPSRLNVCLTSCAL